jgi:sugar O-acyltransferase (sialic acid O-acetyltransferase NeuD family)
MRLVLFGAGNLLGDILDCALALGLTPALVVLNMPVAHRPRTVSIHDRLKLFEHPPQIIALDEFRPQDGECYFLGTTSPQRRQLVEDVVSRFGITFCTLVHPSAHVSPRARVATGVFVGAGSVIAAGAQIGEQVFVNRKVSVGHDSIVEPYVALNGGCNLAGHVHVGQGAILGMGANVIQELEIGAEARVAAGAVVINDVPARCLVAGVPAEFKKNL